MQITHITCKYVKQNKLYTLLTYLKIETRITWSPINMCLSQTKKNQTNQSKLIKVLFILLICVCFNFSHSS